MVDYFTPTVAQFEKRLRINTDLKPRSNIKNYSAQSARSTNIRTNNSKLKHVSLNETTFTTSNTTFEAIRVAISTKHQNAFQSFPKFSKAGIKPAAEPELVARDFYDSCFTKTLSRNIKSLPSSRVTDMKLFNTTDTTHTAFGFLPEQGRSLPTQTSFLLNPNVSVVISDNNNEINYKISKEIACSLENSSHSMASSTTAKVKESPLYTSRQPSIRYLKQNRQNDKNTKNDCQFLYKQSGTNLHDWQQSPNSQFGRKFNVNCTTPKNWLKLKFNSQFKP